MKNSNFVFDELLRLNLRTDRHEIQTPTTSASLLTTFQSSSNCNDVKGFNSLSEKSWFLPSKSAYNFKLIENAKELSYDLKI